MEVVTVSPAATLALSEDVGRRLQPGMVLCLEGELGAGKTLFAQGVAAGLGVVGEVTSPTFNLMNLYRGRLPLVHFDLYRLEDEAELDGIGFYEYAEAPAGVVLIEWGERFSEALPAAYLRVEIRQGEEREGRCLRFSAVGEGYDKLLKELAEKWSS